MDNFDVLVVDDESDFRDSLIKRLKKRNLNVFGAGSGEEALAVLKEEAVDVVILDVKMPGMSGIDTLSAIKRLKPLVEVIMLTGHASVEVAMEGMEMGAFDYLMKPMDIDELLYKLQDACKKKRLNEKRQRPVSPRSTGTAS